MDKKMRVCDVVLNSIWYDPRVIKQLNEYNNCGIDLFAVGLRDKKMNDFEVSKLPGRVTIVPVEEKYYRQNRTILTKIVREITIIKRLKNAIIESKAGVIHANDLDTLLPAFLASKVLKCRLVFDAHEVFSENQNIASSKLKHAYWSLIERILIKKVDLLVCVSNSALNYYKEKYGVNKAIVVTNSAQKSDLSTLLPKNKAFFEVINHGQYYPGRGYDIMLKAAQEEKSKHIRYVLRGFGTMEAELKDFAKRNSINNVIFEPPVKVYELIAYAARSMVGVAITEPVCLNFKLSVSNKLFEYAAAGLPVIMSDIPEHVYLNNKFHFGIILKENSASCLRNAVEKMYSDQDFYNTCAENALKMSEVLNWSQEFKKLLDIEYEMIGGNKSE